MLVFFSDEARKGPQKVLPNVVSGDPSDGAAVQELDLSYYMGGCPNYGPFLDPCYNTAPNI